MAAKKNTAPKKPDAPGVTVPTKKVGRLTLPFNTLSVKELEEKVGVIEETVIVIRKPAKAKVGGYVYASKTAAGRVHAIKPVKSLLELQARLADYGLSPDQYEVISTSLTKPALDA